MWQAFIKFNVGLLSLPKPWLAWLGLLVALNGLVPLFYLERLESQLTLAVFAAGAMLGVWLVARQGFTKLLGLMHFGWFLLLPYLASQLHTTPADDLFGFWLRAVIATNAISLVIDVVDVVRYLRGERADLVASEY